MDYWYRIIFADSTGDTSVPTTPVQNVTGGTVPTVSAYTEVAELTRVLGFTSAPSPEQTVAMQRVIEAASAWIDSYLAPGAPYFPAPYPALVIQVNLERAVEHWKQEQSPFGLIAMGGETAPAFAARNSWRRTPKRCCR